MKKNEVEYDLKFMTIFIKSIAFVFRWFCLASCIVFTGFTIVLLIMYFMKGNSLPTTMLAPFVDILTKFETSDVENLVKAHSMVEVIIATVGYGFASAVTSGLLYSIVAKFNTVFDSIVKGQVFTKDNVDIVNSLVPESILVAFVTPLVIYAIYTSTKILSMSDIDVSGILIIFAVYIAQLIFNNGYELATKEDNKRREINELKATLNEEKINSIKNSTKKEVEKKAPAKKETTKKTSVKKTTKKTTSK